MTILHAFAVLDAAQLPGVDLPVQATAETGRGTDARHPMLCEQRFFERIPAEVVSGTRTLFPMLSECSVCCTEQCTPGTCHGSRFSTSLAEA